MNNPRIGMRDVPLNENAISILKSAEWFLDPKNYKTVRLGAKECLTERQVWIGESCRERIMGMGQHHDGFPEKVCAYGFGMPSLKVLVPDRIQEVGDKIVEVIELLSTQFTLRRNALFSVYPPGGFISWHNNANASAYNFIFTWSETGAGGFRYWDWEKNKVVTIKDVPGWQCKAGYFGSYTDPVNALCYHSAYADCLRMTIAFTVSREDAAIGLQDWIIEDISS